MDHGFVGKRPVLRFANNHGPFHVPGLEDDAHDHHRSAAADDDEDHARDHGRPIHDLSHLERPGRVYSYEQPGRHPAAVVAEPHASASGAGSEPDARQERQEQEAITETQTGPQVTSHYFVHDLRTYLKNLFITENFTPNPRPTPCAIFWRQSCAWPDFN